MASPIQPTKSTFDHTSVKNPEFRFGDRDLIRVWADENAPTFEFLLENGVIFNDCPPTIVNGGSVPRLYLHVNPTAVGVAAGSH